MPDTPTPQLEENPTAPPDRTTQQEADAPPASEVLTPTPGEEYPPDPPGPIPGHTE